MGLQPSRGLLLASSHSSPGSRRPLPQGFGSGTGMVGMSGRASAPLVEPVEPPTPVEPLPALPAVPVGITPVPASGSRDRFAHAIVVAASSRSGNRRSQDISGLETVDADLAVRRARLAGQAVVRAEVALLAVLDVGAPVAAVVGERAGRRASRRVAVAGMVPVSAQVALL